MKKIIGILAIMFIAIGVFGQKSIRNYSFIESTPTGNNTIEDAIQRWNVTDGDYDWINYVHFVQNERLYILAYEPDENFEYGVDRDVYLYSKDIHDINSPWVKASNVVSTSNWLNIRNYSEFDFFLSEKSRGSKGKVDVQENCVIITVGYELMTNGSVSINEPMTFIFKPQGNNFRCYAKSNNL